VEPNWALTRKRETLEKRARIIQSIRAFFVARGYLEVETPHRIPGNAPELHIDAAPAGNGFLHTSPELCMKRMLAAGYPRLFQICRVWREQERGGRHLPEFTLLEWYRVGVDYRALMDECEQLFAILVPEGSIVVGGHSVNFDTPWERLTVKEAFGRFASLSLEKALLDDRFDEILALEVEPHLGLDRPLILHDYPVSLAALARRSPIDPSVAERFELYIAGIELANAFSELTDPVEQRNRFVQDEASRRLTGKQPYPLPEKFLSELTAMPPSAGIALGVDRLVMLMTGAAKIDDVVAFIPEDL